ncbi:hypothetical protein EJP77_03575 [Paenibacillus zeisoli]|uniref:Helix-turn-helix domain-containing protein n=1 Tax=Paenibacillus zeisoli TaxID=2496267 RepID=A0A433XPR2_9BACL|nr:UPF0175 family protein [Paenibacillus zeisoli]RUT36083.1 hypothetical protein EJP77_03575 [Paenibacillus zeisoli]
MDKRKVIHAYQRGFLTLQECAQILGVERRQVESLLGSKNEEDSSEAEAELLGRETVG